ncbi:unnamed protein product [Effrenium voratum]|uniref:Uncharacterized protein n=1 Tax=Effrenium voratum TaxID=2562239 RepID=A0AA36J692_9DINO|nr:unnamed protein product [Effrenium voratum]CAJ1438250.1 unnamed protein product [Effrenium voratum]
MKLPELPKRPAEWGGELPEDPILSSQLPPLAGRDKVSKAFSSADSGERSAGSRKSPQTVPAAPELCKGARQQRQYNILAALGIEKQKRSHPPGGDEHEIEPASKRRKEEEKGAMQLFQQLASRMWKPRRNSVVEGIVEERSQGRLQVGAEPSSFEVRLKTSSGKVKVCFDGPAARAFHRSLGLQRGGRIRIQGYNSQVRDGVEELQLKEVHPGLSVKVVATATMCQSEEVLQVRDLQGHLRKVQTGEAKAVVSVEAIARSIGKLEHQELAMQPGEFAATRTIELQCLYSESACLWRLWDAQAEDLADCWQGKHIIIHGTRVRQSNGPELTGCVSVKPAS